MEKVLENEVRAEGESVLNDKGDCYESNVNNWYCIVFNMLDRCNYTFGK